MNDVEWLIDQLAKAAQRIEELEARVVQLEARPQSVTLGGSTTWAWPWGTQVVSGPTMVQRADGQYQETTYVYVSGDNAKRETPKGSNGPAGKLGD